jgi:hypothetical protein
MEVHIRPILRNAYAESVSDYDHQHTDLQCIAVHIAICQTHRQSLQNLLAFLYKGEYHQEFLPIAKQ